MISILKLNKLNYHINNNNILKNINYTFKKRELVGILGANGSGKSTLLKVIAGYLKKTNGDIYIDELSLDEMSVEKRAQYISYIPQSPNKNLKFLIKDFIRLGRIPHLENHFIGFNEKDERVVNTIIENLNLTRFLNRYINELSGGEFQRVLLARTFAQDCDILILDEPTSALDINHSLEFLKYLKNEINEKERIGIIVLHDINLATLFCNKIIFLKEGEIKYSGNPKEIIKEEILEEIYSYKPKILKSGDNIYVVPKLEEL